MARNTAHTKACVHQMRCKRVTPAFSKSTMMRPPTVGTAQYYQLGVCKLCRPNARKENTFELSKVLALSTRSNVGLSPMAPPLPRRRSTTAQSGMRSAQTSLSTCTLNCSADTRDCLAIATLPFAKAWLRRLDASWAF